MKHIATIILLLATQIAFAKGTDQAFTTVGPNIGGGSFPHFTPGTGDAINNTVSLRVTGKTYLKYNGTMFIPHDSTTYSYTNGRGGIPDITNLSKDDNILFSESYSYDFNNQFGNYTPNLHRTQKFGQENKVISLVYANWRATANAWRDSLRYLYNYSNGKMVASILERWLGNLWANGIESTIEYNGDVVAKMNSKLYEVNFTYDANKNLTSVTDKENTPSGWQNKERHTYEYLNKDVIKYTLEKWDAASGVWVNYKMWDYTYTGPDVDTEIEHDWNGSAWTIYGRHLYLYDGSHNKLVDTWQLWNGSFQNDTKTDWVYNHQNLPEKITTLSWNGSSWIYTVKDHEYHYYYETYFPENIGDKPLANATVNLFPVPTATQLNINLQLDDAQPLEFSICNVQGKVVSHWAEPAVKQYRGSVSVADMPAGNYFLKVHGRDSEITHSFVVAR